MAFGSGIEVLEGRTMFAATAVLVNGGTLIVRGEPSELSLTVSEFAVDPGGTNLPNTVAVNEVSLGPDPTQGGAVGPVPTFIGKFSGVKQIAIYGTTGNDTIRYNGENLGAMMVAGGGTERLIVSGGPGSTVLATAGKNTIIVDSSADGLIAATNTLVVTGANTENVIVAAGSPQAPTTGTTIFAGTGMTTVTDTGSGTTVITLNAADQITSPVQNGQVADPTLRVYVLRLPFLPQG